uniref:Zinc phosphodiesterase ELAC protein 2 n=1 Tax=Corethrella appendiculata TaxID=1370023 RepID=U5EN23_9DIPT
MPIDRKHIEEQQKQRLKIKEKSLKYVPGTVNLQILGSGSPGTPGSVYLFTDQSRYLFNCGEGTQRLAQEHKAKLARLEHIFTTRTCWKRIGGLPGLCLTVQDAGVPNLTLHGPPGLEELFTAMKRFVVLRDLKVSAPQYTIGDCYDDPVMTLQFIPIECERSNELATNTDSNSSSEEVTFDETDYYAHENRTKSSAGTITSNKNKSPINMKKRIETSVMSYICKLKPRPGTLLLGKCVDKGVPPGPLLGQLKSGIDITLPDGTVVKAEDVREPSDPGPVFIIIDIPSIEYLPDLQAKNVHFEAYQSTATDDSNMALAVIHFSPPEIVENEIYRKFMDKFAPSTRHIVINECNEFSGYISSHRIQWQLNQLNEKIFPILKEIPVKDLSTSATKRLKINENNEFVTNRNESAETTSGIYENAPPMSHFHLRPRKGYDQSVALRLEPDEYLKELDILEDFKEALGKLRETDDTSHSNEDEFPRMIFFGTGSCIPNKTRNVSAILLHTSADSSMLLDCGEGTAGQIIRFYGKNKAKEIFRNLKAIYISHLHADHHIGLIEVLQQRRQCFEEDEMKEYEKLLLLAPEQISFWLSFYDRRFESLHNEYQLIRNSNLLLNPLENKFSQTIGVNDISTCYVKHCPHSFGVAVTLNDSRTNEPIKITYSGDTMPCDELVRLGENSTILIHEATMENELLDEARLKMHSTLSQAIEQGQKMNAKFTILTHFSQRYSKIPRIESDQLDQSVGLAFDNMSVSLSDLPTLNSLYPMFKLMFVEHCEEMEQKAIKRANKKFRQQMKTSSS